MSSDSKRARSTVGTNHESMRQRNLMVMIQTIHAEGPLSRAELTARMQLAASTVGDLLSELESVGFVVVEEPTRRRTAGRPSPLVRADSGRVRVLAADVGGDHISAGAFGLGGTMLSRAQAATPRSHDPEDVARVTSELLERLVADLAPESELLGIGVGVAGVVGKDETVRFAPHLGWHDVAFADLLRARLTAPLLIRVANDADLGALADHRRGVAVGVANVLYVGCDDFGVGGGLIFNGVPYRGAGGFAGELGHMLIDPHGRRCQCGRDGCWETEIGLARVAETLELGDSDLSRVRQALANLDENPPALDRVGTYLGLGIASLVNILNVDLVVLGGSLRDLYPVVKRTTDSAFSRAALPALQELATIVPSGIGSDAVLVGGCEMVVSSVFEGPVRALADVDTCSVAGYRTGVGHGGSRSSEGGPGQGASSR